MPKPKDVKLTKPTNPTYSEAIMPHMRALSHPEQRPSALRAVQAYAELRKKSEARKQGMLPELPDVFFADLAKMYWHERLWFERERLPEFSEQLSKLKTATAAYLAAFERAPISVIAAIEGRLVRDGLHNPSVRLADLLKGIEAAAVRLTPPKGKSGAHKKIFADAPVAKLNAVWFSVFGKPVPKASTHRESEESPAKFASHGGQFVFEIMRAIDPRITAEEISTAIDKIPRAQKPK
ncbi:MAG: hypothetical protein Q8M31_09155 [Beijerinckiaceae bacterium]|nr:hypothetical protein [Beijerinckiaceae bacterium]